MSGEGFLDLYPSVLGAAWDALAEPVRRCHQVAPLLRARATFRIGRGTSVLARVMAKLLGFPPPGDGVVTDLEVEAFPHHQEWRRSFAGKKLVTTQYLLDEGRVAERSGLVELRLRPTVEEGALVYAVEAARVCIGPLRLPIPSFFRPRMVARAWAEPGETRMRVDIQVTMPLVGLLVSYTGPVERLDAKDDDAAAA